MISLMDEAPWPALREDIRLRTFEPAPNGAPQWTLFDPLARQYLRIGQLEHAALSRWHLGSTEKIADAISSGSSLQATAKDIEDIRDFFSQHTIVRTDGRALASKLTQASAANQSSLAVKALKTYLFIKIPLWRPQRFLDTAWPLVRHLFQPTTAWLILAIAAFGLYQVAQDWEGYRTSFSYLFSPSGIGAMALALVGIKLLHELGHAFTARRYGVPVARVGVALLVFWPVLYTDTTDAWRLSSKRQRLHISLAGLVVELAIAGLATAAWAITPDGAVRTAFFFLSSASWITSVLVNLNPFMRFDGYYVLSDAMGIQNLQERAFALARWRLREALFQIGDPPPERFEPARQFWLLSYAYGTWFYRVFLFLGIALVLTQLIAPVIGYTLAAIEIGAFLLLPIGKEFMQWWHRRADIVGGPRAANSALCLCTALAACFIPFRAAEHHPAIYRAFTAHTVYAPANAQLRALHVADGDSVVPGQFIATLRSPELEKEYLDVSSQIDALTHALRQRELTPLTGATRSADTGQDAFLTLLRKLEGAREKKRALEDTLGKLRVVATTAGRVEMLDQTLLEGDWIAEASPLLSVKDTSSSSVQTFVRADAAAMAKTTPRFIPDILGLQPILLSNTHTRQDIGRDFRELSLASVHGGPIAAMPGSDGSMKAEMGLQQWRQDPAKTANYAGLNAHIVGTVRLEGRNASLAKRAQQGISGLLGFAN